MTPGGVIYEDSNRQMKQFLQQLETKTWIKIGVDLKFKIVLSV
jgi:hypothetical protein